MSTAQTEPIAIAATPRPPTLRILLSQLSLPVNFGTRRLASLVFSGALPSW